MCFTVLAFWVWGNAEKVLRETPPSCSNLPTKSFPYSEKVFMPGSHHGNLATLIFRPGYGQYGQGCQLLERALAMFESVGDTTSAAVAMQSLAQIIIKR